MKPVDCCPPSPSAKYCLSTRFPAVERFPRRRLKPSIERRTCPAFTASGFDFILPGVPDCSPKTRPLTAGCVPPADQSGTRQLSSEPQRIKACHTYSPPSKGLLDSDHPSPPIRPTGLTNWCNNNHTHFASAPGLLPLASFLLFLVSFTPFPTSRQENKQHVSVQQLSDCDCL